MKRLWTYVAVLVAVMCLAPAAWAANSVVVESRTMATNAVDCPIHVWMENDVDLQGVVVPLVIREVSPGTFISALKLSWAERIYPGGPISDIFYSYQFADPNGECEPGGFGQPATSDDTLKHSVAASPEGVMFVAIKVFSPNLPPGTDVTGSMVLTVDATGPAGTFEVDTTCVDPNSHLYFVNAQLSSPFVPSFTKGVITTVDNTPPTALCHDVTVTTGDGCAADASIDNGSFDPDGDAITLVQDPPGPYPVGETVVQLTVTDANCASSTCQATVTVVDDTPPIISCAYDTVIVVEPGESGKVVEFASSATDECSSVTAVCTPPSGSVFPVGVSTVTCIATDAAGNADTCHFYVAVGSSAYCNDRPIDVNCDGQLDMFDFYNIIDVLYMGVPEPGPCCGSKK